MTADRSTTHVGLHAAARTRTRCHGSGSSRRLDSSADPAARDHRGPLSERLLGVPGREANFRTVLADNRAWRICAFIEPPVAVARMYVVVIREQV